MDPKVLVHIKIVATDKVLQQAFLDGLFDGCEIGSDMWEYLEGKPYCPLTLQILYGPHWGKEATTPEEERQREMECYQSGALYFSPEPAHKIMEALAKEIRQQLRPKEKHT
jgi:hypothetical protein